jgi:hypothetical protein
VRRLDAAFIPGKWQERVSGLSGRACTNAGDLQYQGGLGAVFVALDREMALKQILERRADDPGSRARFLLEAEITRSLEHPGIVPVYGLGTDGDGRPYYAMRFIRGDSLKQAIDDFHGDEGLRRDPGLRSLELRKLLRRFTDVCNAVDYAHTKTSSSRRPTRRGPARCARPTPDWGWHWGRSNNSARWSVSTNLDVQNRPENGPLRRELLLTPLTFLRTLRDDLHGDPDARPEGQLPVRQEPERLSFNVNYCFGNICAMIGDSF